jgi:hypothetical protein
MISSSVICSNWKEDEVVWSTNGKFEKNKQNISWYSSMRDTFEYKER